MPPFSAVLHTQNDALRLGRTLETLLPCAEILIFDHQSTDSTLRIARLYGARVFNAANYAERMHYLQHARNDWIFYMNPSESLTEGLQASLFEWGQMPRPSLSSAQAFSVNVREQVDGRWRQHPEPEIRLVTRHWTHWNGLLPASGPRPSTALQGELLRLAYP
jgi:glycosyltransferase involved in cell wall biosynthesis